MDICHYEKVDKENIEAYFSEDGLYRLYLSIPLLDRVGNRTICIVGQNPSKANENVADKTLHYLEKFVFEKMHAYSKIIMLNLYSRVDTTKNSSDNLESESCVAKFRKIIHENSDFLIVYGKLKNQGAYKFIEKAKELRMLLKDKNVFKIDAGLEYAPHPGNKVIYYGNYCFGVTEYDFSDVQ